MDASTSLATGTRGHLTGRALGDAVLAGSLSTLMLLWRGRTENASAAAPLNAVSHWLWPTQALQRDDASLKHTGTGVAVHYGSSMLWAWLYRELRERRRRPTPVNAVSDAVLVTALASAVDLKVVPKRLSPGFEMRLHKPGVALVYAGFAAGLAIGGLLSLRRPGG